MPRQPTLTPAQQSRDAGLARVRRITWACGLGGVALTAIASAIAALTIPGHTQAAVGTPAGSSASAAQPGTGTQPGDGSSQPQPVAPPADSSGQAPAAAPGTGPVVVSGGS